MGDLVRFRLDGGGAVVVEVAEEPGMEPAGLRNRIVEDAKSSFEEALGSVRAMAGAAMNQFKAMAHRPDEVEIKFGVRLDAKAGAVIAQAGVQGQLEVKIRCTFSDSHGHGSDVEEAEAGAQSEGA